MKRIKDKEQVIEYEKLKQDAMSRTQFMKKTFENTELCVD